MMPEISALTAPRRTGGLMPVMLLAWVALYLLLMAHGDWQWKQRGFLDFGAPSFTALERFGGAVPVRIRDGDWQRVLLSPWLQRSLFSFLLLAWFWSSMGRTLIGIVGRARTWLIFVAGGAGGAIVHTLWHGDSSLVGGAGPFDAIVAGLGAQLLWGLTNRGQAARRLRNGALVSIVLIGAMSWYFTRDAGSGAAVQALIGRESMLGGFASGLLLMLLLGPRRSNRAPSKALVVLCWLVFGLVLAAAMRQAPAAIASSQRTEVQHFLEQLQATEQEAWEISRDLLHATPAKREALGRRLDRLAAHDFFETHEGKDALLRYVAKLRAYTKEEVAGFLVEPACRKTFKVWYTEYERPLRERVGMEPRMLIHHYWGPI